VWSSQKRDLVVAIYEPAWFISVVEYLKRRGVRFHYYYSREAVPSGCVVYTDYGLFLDELADRANVTVIYDPSRDCRVLEKAILATKYADSYGTIVVGVDPGSRLSYVVLSDEELLLYGDGGLRELERDLDYILTCMPHRELRVKVGSGYNAAEVAMRIKNKYRVPVELIDEKYSTPSASRLDEVKFIKKRLKELKPFRYKDIYAAYKIAISKGVEVL